MLFVLGVTVPHDMGATAAGPKSEIEQQVHCATFSIDARAARQPWSAASRTRFAASIRTANVPHL
jgi:hypothetical protein